MDEDIVARLAEQYCYEKKHDAPANPLLKEAGWLIMKYRATLRQIADSGNSINAHLAAQALRAEHER